MTMREDRLKERVDEIRPRLAKARELAEKADTEKREMTPAEQSEFDAIMTAGRAVSDAVKAARHDQAVLDFAKELSEEVGLPGMGGGAALSGASSKSGQRLSFKGMGQQAASKVLGSPDGIKAITLAPSGSAVVSQAFTEDPVALGQPANSLLSVLPVVVQNPEFSYLRQTVRTNAAAVVAEGATKPTSTYSVVRVEDKLDVVAHLSEGVPRFWFLDNSALQMFLENELTYGLQTAVEALALADINATSGIQLAPYATSPLVTLRKSLTALETAGYVAGSVVLHPADWEAIELSLSTISAIEHLSLPYDAASRRLYGVPVVVSNAQAAGVSHALAIDAVALNTGREGIEVTWSENSNATDFSQNLIRARCEGRYATAVYSPLGVVKGDLTA